MDRVAPDGSWCLWQHVGAEGVPAPAPGELVLVRRSDASDPSLGEFTFKRWVCRDSGFVLEPMSHDPSFQPILLDDVDEQDLVFVARFIEVLHIDSADIVGQSSQQSGFDPGTAPTF